MILRVLLQLLITVTLVFTCGAAIEKSDLIDTPSVKAKLAGRSLLNGVTMAGTSVIAVGQRGHILISDDHGKNWNQVSVPVSSDLVAVHFPTATSGWAVGHDGVVLHSGNGGLTWEKQFDGRAAGKVMVDYYAKNTQKGTSNPEQSSLTLQEEAERYLKQGADKPFLDVWFENDKIGYIVGAFNLIFKTSDGGKNWVPFFDRIDNPKRLHLYAIRNVGTDLFIVGEQGSVFRFDSKSGQFKVIKTPYAGTYFGITGKTGVLIAYGMRGTVYRSGNGGISWNKIETGAPIGLTDAIVTEDGWFVLVNQAGHVLLSSDDGVSFTPLKIEHPVPASGVTSLDRNTLVIVGLGGAQLQSIK